ncbi:MAG TPA: ricin-type beta-trefoil lectin domain protein [Gemmatimonadaceae bacterium]
MGINRALRAASALAIVTLVSVVGCSDAAQPTAERIAAPTSALASLTSGTGTSSTITSRMTGSPCVTTVNESNAAGTAVQIWNCYGSPAQSYSWMADGSIRAFASTTPMCLGTTGTGQDGDRIILQACNGSAQQKWTATTTNEIHGINGKCLDVVNASAANGARLMLWNCYGSPSQKWDNAASASSPSSPPPVQATAATVSVSLSSTLPVKQTAQATATVRDASGNVLSGQTIAWSSSNSAVASVSASGLVTAVAAGSATIVATSGGKTGSAALTVTAAVTGVAVLPGQSIQAAVNANPAGTTFILKAGTHTRQSVIPKSGDVFQGETGTVLDGQGVGYAFSKGGAPYPSNVTIRGLKVTGYSPAMQSAAIDAGGYYPNEGTTGWVIDGNEVSYNGEYGIRLGNNSRVVNNNVHHNNRLNIAGSANNALVENNEIAFGNYQNANNTNFEAGGTKFAQTDGLIVRGNYVHDNVGVGIHMDENNINTTIESNKIDKNGSEGVAIEISYATIIRNNTVTNNGWADPRNRYSYLWNAGIGVHASQNVEIYGNTVSGNYAGIVGIEQNRSADKAVYGPHIVQNMYVHNNTITQNTLPRTSGALSVGAGIATDIAGNTAVFTSRNNRFVANTYYLGSNPQPFAWQFGTRTVSQWKAYGMDVGGIFN